MYLLTCSFDFTVCLWQVDEDTKQWNVTSTLGAMTGNKHAYFGAKFLDTTLNAAKRQIMAYTFGGAVHLWSREAANEDAAWSAENTIKGHFGEVTDLDWDPNSKSCLVSCSADQTTRLVVKHSSTYQEISRPQVHGYDMNCLSLLKNQGFEADNNLPFRLISGGDEKVIRLFEAPYSFVKRFNCLSDEVKEKQVKPIKFRSDVDNQVVEQILGEREESARKQPLGLMNKPQILLATKGLRVNEEETGGMNENFNPESVLTNTRQETGVIQDVISPPVEEILMTRTLWPES